VPGVAIAKLSGGVCQRANLTYTCHTEKSKMYPAGSYKSLVFGGHKFARVGDGSRPATTFPREGRCTEFRRAKLRGNMTQQRRQCFSSLCVSREQMKSNHVKTSKQHPQVSFLKKWMNVTYYYHYSITISLHSPQPPSIPTPKYPSWPAYSYS
jgi:hypothetical protein